MRTQARTFLMFEGRAEEAMNFYVSVVPRSSMGEIVRWPAGGPAPEGSVMKATFTLGGQTVMCSDSYVKHDFTFTPSISFWLDCETEEEIGRLAAALKKDGGELMPLGNYGFSRLFAWVKDRFGVTWQLNWQ